MKCNLATIYLMIHFSSALSPLPAPENVSVISVNYNHVLQWDPGPGTPPGTTYNICCRVNRKETPCPVTHITPTRATLKLKDPMKLYIISVQAVHNLSKSALANTYCTPFRDTVIGPPTLTLTGCGTCLNLTITMPETNLKTSDKKSLQPQFKIQWKKRQEETRDNKKPEQVTEVISFFPTNIINNLERGVEYSVKVYLETKLNKNLKASNWYSAATSVLEPSKVPVVLSGVIVPCVVGGVFLLVLGCCLLNAGYLCLKERLPRGLMTTLVRASILTPEKTIPDPVSSNTTESLHKGKRVRAKPHSEDLDTEAAADEEDETEDEEGNNCYMGRAAEKVSDSSDYHNASAAGVSFQEDSVSLSLTRLSVEIDMREELVGKSTLKGQPEIKIEETIEDQLLGHGIRGVNKERNKKEGSGNINLFSVTLGAIEQGEEEENQDTIDFLEFSKFDQQRLLPMDFNTFKLGRRESESEMLMHHQTLLDSMHTNNPAKLENCDYAGTNSDPTNTHPVYLVTHGGNVQTVDQTEEEEDEEEDLSGYMGR